MKLEYALYAIKSMKAFNYVPYYDREACDLACDAIREKMERENPIPITWDKLKSMNEVPVYIVDLFNEGRDGWYILTWDYRKSGQYLVLSSRHCNEFLTEEYGESWVAYKYNPKEA